jgi:hypothetical protein
MVGMDKYLTYIYNRIIQNQNLCKLLYYDTDLPLSEPDIEDCTLLYKNKTNQRLYFTPYTDDVSSDGKSTLNITIGNFQLDKKSTYFKNFDIEFIIMVNHHLWHIMDGGVDEIRLRPNAIFNELIATFHESKSGIGNDMFAYASIVRNRVGTSSGYKLCYNTKDFPLL